MSLDEFLEGYVSHLDLARLVLHLGDPKYELPAHIIKAIESAKQEESFVHPEYRVNRIENYLSDYFNRFGLAEKIGEQLKKNDSLFNRNQFREAIREKKSSIALAGKIIGLLTHITFLPIPPIPIPAIIGFAWQSFIVGEEYQGKTFDYYKRMVAQELDRYFTRQGPGSPTDQPSPESYHHEEHDDTLPS